MDQRSAAAASDRCIRSRSDTSVSQERFREIRLDPSRRNALPNAIVDRMVRERLQKELLLNEKDVAFLLDRRIPRIAHSNVAPIDLRIGAAFVSGAYEAAANFKSSLDLLSIEALRGLGDAYLARHAALPGAGHIDEVIRYYEEALRRYDPETRQLDWSMAAYDLAGVLFKEGQLEQAASLQQRAYGYVDRGLGAEDLLTLKVAVSLGHVCIVVSRTLAGLSRC